MHTELLRVSLFYPTPEMCKNFVHVKITWFAVILFYFLLLGKYFVIGIFLTYTIYIYI